MSTLAGVFILGVLAGWLVEWIFVRLFVPNPKKKVEVALQAARKENEKLQQQVRELQAAAAHAVTVAPVQATESAVVAVVPPVPTEPEALTEVVPEAVVPDVVAAEPDVAVEAAEPVVQVEPEMQTVTSNDDLTKLGGIGPKLAEAMKAAGISRYAQLVEMSVEEVNARLADSGIRYGKAAAESWAAQAKMAEAGDWKALKEYQASLKG
ncbi:MAG TPA: helix-hairpin-helix domain-containing protein [Candidatus Thiothrix moscowensis]|uniref:helix-hairpin-helix domain-containing protein n=1 Tax=unclassified Thiothrix TaxID=2636184 RepID=UPI0025D1C49F|nr:MULTISPECIES: helix-hairpin-helix domain-containing protein [unclassified Thiothrix]HRJ54513.1 helix-hairpin-helix domain-containing protein [Candidatus Thiothrix moscowensis]HRJ94872.1 helix-hairpin-helix domain-containing protein [Candidatus Thiothrix moscowensis]